jgi:acyl carrier protein
MNIALENELKQLIIETLALEDLTVADFGSQEALFNGGIELDSIDALELGLVIRKKYDVRIDTETDDVEKIFASVANLAEFIESRRTQGTL